MPSIVRIVTDSNAMLPAQLVARFGVLVVPMTIVVDGKATAEDAVDLPAFYAALRTGVPITTAAPSPGLILERYQQAVAHGADQILSIHVGSNQSGTVAAAMLAIERCAVPVTVVDTRTASFLQGCCVWRAGEVLADGGTVGGAAGAARAVAAAVGSVFTIGEINRARHGGRLVVAEGDGVPVYSSKGADFFELKRVNSAEDAASVMAAQIALEPGPLRVGVGHADAAEDADTLAQGLLALDNVEAVTRYVVGPSVAAHTGAGTFGAVFHPV